MPKDTPKALVTGATGFVGRHLVRHLAAVGWAVDVLIRSSSDPSALADTDDVAVYTYDGSGASIHGAMAASKPDVVFHLATHYVAEHAAQDIDAMIEGNVRFGTHLLQAMDDAGVRAIVNAGTSWQNFEDADYRPVNLYAATKQAFEDVLAYYVDACGFRAVTLRLFDTYGPNDTRKKLFWALAHAQNTGEALRMSPGEQLLDLVYIDDANRALEQAGDLVIKTKDAGHAVYGVSSGDRHTLRTVVETFAKVSGVPITVQWGAREYRAREVMTPWSNGHALPGWTANVTLEEGIAKMLSGHV